jgi:D-alanyl-D-alanine dipeptidase
LFSPPGKGGHPRGMAVDIILVDKNGAEVDMGTPFDYLTADKSDNPAARDYADFGRGEDYNKMVRANRKILEDAMVQAARQLGKEIWPLPQEWWDFRFKNEYTATFAPVADADLPARKKMMAKPKP